MMKQMPEELFEVRSEPGACQTCKGTLVAEVPHPMRGQDACPEPYITIDCPECMGGEEW